MNRFSMKAILLLVTLSHLAGGCTLDTQRVISNETVPTPEFTATGQYYYYLESQLQRKRGNLDQALVLLKQAIALDPQTIYLQRELAVLLLQKKDSEGALQVLEAILQTAPNDIETLILYGRTQQGLKKTAEAIAVFRRIITQDPQQESIYLLLGNLYMDNHEKDRAFEVYTQLIEHFPGSYVGHFFLGKLLADQGRTREAETEFLKTLNLEPDLEEPRFELLKLYKAQGDAEKVDQIYSELLETSPDSVRAALEVAYFYHTQGRLKEAAEMLEDLGARSLSDPEVLRYMIQRYVDPKEYDAAAVLLEGLLKGAPDSSDLNYLAGIVFEGQDIPEKAIRHFSKVGPDSRFYQNAVVHVAFLFQSEKKINEAIDTLSSALRKMPDSTEFMLYLGSFFEESENYSEAEKIIKKGLELEPQNAKLLFRLGVVYDKWGRKEAAIDLMKSVIELEPQNANALNYLGYTYADLGRNLDEAERLVQEALKHKPDDGYITDSLGWVYYKQGIYPKAIEFLEKAHRLVPDDPTIMEHLGDAYLKANQTRKALEFYERSLQFRKTDKTDIERKIQELKQKGR